MPININKSDVRIELFFQSPDDLRDRIQFLSSKGYKAFNIVNKNNRDTLIDWVDIVREASDEETSTSICVHYSAKYNKSRQKNGAFEKFHEFIDEMKNKQGHNEVLLITGSGDQGKFNSLSGLESLQERTITPIAVAFNPFFPEKQDLEQEKDRLLQKIQTNRVDKIYIQFGTDLERLRTSLDWLLSLDQAVQICGSIFLPTKRLIQQQKFRPWNGVFLSGEFLESAQTARGIVLEMMRLYQSKQCEIVVEAPGVRNEKDVAIVEALLQDRDGKHDQFQGLVSPQKNDSSSLQEAKKRRIEEQPKSLLAPSPLLSKTTLLEKPAILLFSSHDVRIHDNKAFQLASSHSSVIPVFLWSKQDSGQKWGVVGAAQVVLKDALKNLNATLTASADLKLICRQTTDNDFQLELARLCTETGASTVYWNKEHTTESRIREQACKTTLESMGVQAIECNSSLLYDPILLKVSEGFNGGHWGTLMPFLKACRKQLGEPRRPIPRHKTFALLQRIRGPSIKWPESTPIEDLDLAVVSGKDKWNEPIEKRFPMSEDDALKAMNHFFARGFQSYEKERSRADITSSTSRLSAHLRIGTLSPNELYYKIEDSELEYDRRKTISRRLFWRDLAYFQLLNFPNMRDISIRQHYDRTEWVQGEEETRRFEAWRKGQTGYPLVDAGMRELWETGWMTQSIRMVVASFLTEYLRVNWVKGCEWFHYTLVDTDSAINAMMWQNAGRSGIDQWNFVMSPVAASQDASGERR